jgi:hypothetical protein
MFLSAFATIGASIDQGKLLKGGSAMSEENKAVVRRFNGLFGECWRTGNAYILDEVLAPEFVYHSPGPHQTAEASNSPFSC